MTPLTPEDYARLDALARVVLPLIWETHRVGRDMAERIMRRGAITDPRSAAQFWHRCPKLIVHGFWHLEHATVEALQPVAEQNRHKFLEWVERFEDVVKDKNPDLWEMFLAD